MPKQLTKADLTKNSVFGENPTELICRLGARAQFNADGRTLSFQSGWRKGATLVANWASDKTMILTNLLLYSFLQTLNLAVKK
jgi:hypothetical protein